MSNKPTNEELQEKINEAANISEEELNKKTDDEPEIETPEEETPETPVEEPKEEEKPQEDDDELKKKLSASARENQKIYAKNRVINKALIEAEETPEPTEKELAQEFPDWDTLSDVEKAMAKETVVSRRWRQSISKAKEQATKIEKWTESVETFLDDPKTLVDIPELEGKTDAFKEFATKEENNSVPFKTLVGAFLYDQSKGKVTHKGKMFENGSGGPNEKPQPKSDRLTLEESRRLRESDYAKWKEYLSAGKIELNI